MRRMFELLTGTQSAHYHICLSKAFHLDLQWWATFLEMWNRVTIMHCGNSSSDQLAHHVRTESMLLATLAVECGGHVQVAGCNCSGSRYIQGSGRSYARKALRSRSCFPLSLPAQSGALRSWRGPAVTFHCKNMGLIAVINSSYSRVPQIMHLLRCLFFIRAFFQISVWAVHVPGQHNAMADAISRT